ncbi:MAG: hypothetical protein FWG98_01895 [Candidatus Cloacimonetes bacterium]|nr:hypothetical protein [Candidatus Cloacimonadota bacterium]
MSNKKEEIVDKFLEKNNMDYLFCILADKESERLSILPDSIKRGFYEKTTTMALKHIALNDVPDYIVEEVETKESDDYENFDYTEEYEDDRKDLLNKDLDVFENSTNIEEDYKDD